MATFANSFSNIREERLPLQVFLREGHSALAADPARFLRPFVDHLDELHRSGYSHGALTPACILVSPAGVPDIGFLQAHQNRPHEIEKFTYYPDGPGETLEERQLRDIHALGALFHLMVADHPPARRERRTQRLQDQPSSGEWPADFVLMIDRMLDSSVDSTPPSLSEIAASLGGPVPEAPPEAPPEATCEPAPAEPQPTPEPLPERPAVLSLPPIRLPNAMVGREFSVPVPPLPGSDDPLIGNIGILSSLPPGLEIQGGMLAGKPETSGDFEIRLRCHAPSDSADAPSVERTLLLSINPDPRSLWKDLPSDSGGEFWKPDSDSSSLAGGPLTVIGASLRGRSHAHVGSFRDDDMSMAWLPGSSWYSLTVADGAGSAKYSRQGSKIACDTVLQFFTDYFATGVAAPLTAFVEDWSKSPDDSAAASKVRNELYQKFGNAALTARKAIEEKAVDFHATSRDFHTTLITALVRPLTDGRWFVASFSVGDGAAALVAVPGGEPCLLTRPDGGEFAGQTVFLTMKEVLTDAEALMARIKMVIVPDFQALLLVTDGISDPRFDSETRLADPTAWDSLWTEMQTALAGQPGPEAAGNALVDWMGFHSPGHHDDRTVILATPHLTFPQP